MPTATSSDPLPTPIGRSPAMLRLREIAAIPAQMSRSAVGDITPMALGVLPFAIVIGVTMGRMDVGLATALTLSFALYGGSVQLAMLSLVDAGSGIAIAALTAALVNARLLLYGAVLAPRFRPQPRWFRFGGPHLIVDQTTAIATARPDLGDPVRFRWYWLIAGTVLSVVWLGGIAIGMGFGPVLPERSPLEVATAALFVAMLVPRLTDRTTAVTALTSAGVSLATAGLPNGLGVLAGIGAGVTLAVVLTKREVRR